MKANHDLIAQNIIKYRLERNIKQKDFAKMIGITPTTLSDIEGARKKASMDLLLKMSVALKINIDYLLDGNINTQFISDNINLDDLSKEQLLFVNTLNSSTLIQKENILLLLKQYIENIKK